MPIITEPWPLEEDPLVHVEPSTLSSMETTGTKFEMHLASCIRVASQRQQKMLVTLFAGIVLKHRNRAARDQAKAEREGLKL